MGGQYSIGSPKFELDPLITRATSFHENVDKYRKFLKMCEGRHDGEPGST